MSKSEQTLTIRGASASRSKSAQEVLDIERRIIDDCIQVRLSTFRAKPSEEHKRRYLYVSVYKVRATFVNDVRACSSEKFSSPRAPDTVILRIWYLYSSPG
jgi:hypothetical protein